MAFKIVIESDYALFTRPEMKVERVSYDVPTPSALEGFLKSIFWKPAIRYVIDKIVVFNPVRFISVRRNEVKNKISASNVRKAMTGRSNPRIYNNEINQRASMLLRDVKYGVEFHFEMTGICSEKEGETPSKYAEIIERRLLKGQYFRAPCLGCREFAVKKIEVVDEFDYSSVSKENTGNRDLGYMLYGLRFEDKVEKLKESWNREYFSDKAKALFYHPYMVDGIIDVQEYGRDLKC